MTKTELLDAHLLTFDPENYARTRNFENGMVTKLSAYISRGVINLHDVYLYVKHKGYSFEQAEKFYQELAWREFWQQYAIHKGLSILQDLRCNQHPVEYTGFPKALEQATTGIKSIDKSILKLYETGYMHNHWRMYVAGMVCNIGRYQWLEPARWMYYHLNDADWASNFLSWQWVAGTFNQKKYIVNQENINKYSTFSQHDTFLDYSYDHIAQLASPEILHESVQLNLKTELPKTAQPTLREELPTLVYNFYNLPLNWHPDWEANRILLLEPAHFEAFPVSEKVLNFGLQIATQISDLQLYTGDFESLQNMVGHSEIHYVKHPLFSHYSGVAEDKIGLFEHPRFYSSFFKFWNEHKIQLMD